MSLWMESIGYDTCNMGMFYTILQVPHVEHLKKHYLIYYENINWQNVS